MEQTTDIAVCVGDSDKLGRIVWGMWGIEPRLRAVERKLDLILNRLQQQGATVMADFAALEAQVKANTDAEQSAALLLAQLHTDLLAAQASSDPAQLQAVIDGLGASQAMLAAAVKANTPAA